jgi:tetratricopeptide (TPR) repeat protein
MGACLTFAESNEAINRYERGEYRQAVTLFSQQIGQSSANADLQLWLGKSYLKIQKWDEAANAIERAVQADPNNGLYHLWLGRAYGAKASHAMIFARFGWARKVVREFETAKRLSPDSVDVRFDLLEYYLSAPGVVGGGRDKAEEEAKAIARISPCLSFAARARIFEEDKDWDRARSEYIVAVKSCGDQADRYQDLADFLFKRGDYTGAEANARKALAMDTNLPTSRLILAASLIGLQQRLAEAKRILKDLSISALGDDGPAFEEVYYWLGQAYLIQQEKSDARQAFETSLRFNPDFEKAKNAISRLRGE